MNATLQLYEASILEATQLSAKLADNDLFLAYHMTEDLQRHLLGLIEPRFRLLVDVVEGRHDELHDSALQSAAAAAVPLELDDTSQQSVSVLIKLEGDMRIETEDTPEEVLRVKKEIEASDAFSSFVSTSSSFFGINAVEAEEDVEEDMEEEEDSEQLSLELLGLPEDVLCADVPVRGAIQDSVEVARAASREVSMAIQRRVLREALRCCQAEELGPVFNFSSTFTAVPNMRAAGRVIQRARSLPQCSSWSAVVWRNAPAMVRKLFKTEKDKRTQGYRRRACRASWKAAKLRHRQRVFDLLIRPSASMQQEEKERYRTVLQRDLVSSDEEVEEAPEAQASSSGGGLLGTDAVSDMSQLILRARRLPWESSEVTRLKRAMDALYAQRLAPKSLQHRTLRREPCVATAPRPPSTHLPEWTIRSDWTGGSTSCISTTGATERQSLNKDSDYATWLHQMYKK